MTAMDKASENAEELMKELKINYNKTRQSHHQELSGRLWVVLRHWARIKINMNDN